MQKDVLFAEALKCESPEERLRFLEEACAGDEALRTEIESLLDAHFNAGSFLNETPAEFERTQVAGPLKWGECIADDHAWRELLKPSEIPEHLGTLGPYEVIEVLGRGGFGIVLRAHDPKLNRAVAIKLLAPHVASTATAVQRFLREARAAAAVSHPHVVAIHSIDDSSRPPMIIMEYVDGQSLQQKIDSTGALDLKSILRIGMQTASGLASAHQQGLVHRDIKPANILLENGVERVKLTDFGLARAVDDVGMTKTGQISGTPQYMSPEQAQGQRVDERTDLFSLGAVLYAMCTGSAAFRADSAMAVMNQVVNSDPRPIRELNADIPDWLCEIVETLLAKNPDDRLPSAEQVARLLSGHLAHLQQPDSHPQPERVGPHRSAAADRSSPFVSWKRAVVGAVALAMSCYAVWLGFEATRNLARQSAPATYRFRDGTPEGIVFPLHPRSLAYREIHVAATGQGRSRGTEPRLEEWPRQQLSFVLVRNDGPGWDVLKRADYDTGRIEIDFENSGAYRYRGLDGIAVAGESLSEDVLMQWMQANGIDVEQADVQREISALYELANQIDPRTNAPPYRQIGEIVDREAFLYRHEGFSRWEVTLDPWVEPAVIAVWTLIGLGGIVAVWLRVRRSKRPRGKSRDEDGTDEVRLSV